MRLSFFQEVLLATAAGLGGFVIVELSLPLPDGSSDEAPVAATLLSELFEPGAGERPGFTLPPRKSLSDFVERPLFERSRRAAPDRAAFKDGHDDGLDIALIGTIIEMNETIAILRAEGARPVRARIGDSIGGWQVSQIRQDGVLLSNNQSTLWVPTGAQ